MMGQIDSRVAARLALRAALARIVDEHPDVTSADSQARLDAWLTTEEANDNEPPTDDDNPAA